LKPSNFRKVQLFQKFSEGLRRFEDLEKDMSPMSREQFREYMQRNGDYDQASLNKVLAD
jgi:uncharacterized protein YPO0396